ncbi:MAG: LamG domain-containing protein [Planctomycetales bacterium]|nr:LamG domain-containing protein [Planctomycetales bacterium]
MKKLFLCLLPYFVFAGSVRADIVAYYSFEQPNPFADQTGNGFDAVATPTTNVEIVEGIRGTAARFPGLGATDNPITDDDFLLVPIDDTPGFTVDEDLSISIWIMRNDPQDDIGGGGPDSGADGIYDSLDGTASGIQLFLLPDGTVNGRFDSEEAGFVVVNDPEALEDNFDEDGFAWHHVAYTFDRDDAEALLYVDGELVDAVYAAGEVESAAEGDFIPSQDFWIGRANQHSADSLLDDFALFNHVLTADEVAQIYAGTLSPADFIDSGLLGDFDADGLLTATDIDLLSAAVRDGDMSTKFDVNADGSVNQDDRATWVNELKNTFFGDSNLDGEFNSSDFVTVFTAGEYEDGIANNSTWGEGDWNGDGDFDSSDFVAAFSSGGYEKGTRPAAVVPEPTLSYWIVGLSLVTLSLRRKSVRSEPKPTK